MLAKVAFPREVLSSLTKALRYRFFLWPHIISITNFCVLLQKFCELMQSFLGERKSFECFLPYLILIITMLSCWGTKATFTKSVQIRLFVYQIGIWLSTLFIAAVQIRLCILWSSFIFRNIWIGFYGNDIALIMPTPKNNSSNMEGFCNTDVVLQHDV